MFAFWFSFANITTQCAVTVAERTWIVLRGAADMFCDGIGVAQLEGYVSPIFDVTPSKCDDDFSVKRVVRSAMNDTCKMLTHTRRNTVPNTHAGPRVPRFAQNQKQYHTSCTQILEVAGDASVARIHASWLSCWKGWLLFDVDHCHG